MKQLEKLIISVIIIAVIAASIVLLSRKSHPVAPKNTMAQQPAPDPKHPNFIMGYFVSATKDKVIVKYNGLEVSANISASTKLANKISDYKPGQLIMVYFSSQPVGSVYQADRIQLIGK